MGESPSSLEPAIELYVDGKYDEAVDRLEELTRKLSSEENLAQTYLYLGRAYMALGQYDRAIDAFTLGSAYDGDNLFREYLRRLSLVIQSSPEKIAGAAKVTRGQLAITIDRVIYGRAPGEGGDLPKYEGDDLGGCLSVRNGMMSVLPDGKFHAGDHVTRGQFYVVVCRLLDREANSAGATAVFPDGFNWATGGGHEARDPKERLFVSGQEVVAILERVAALKDKSHGG